MSKIKESKNKKSEIKKSRIIKTNNPLEKVTKFGHWIYDKGQYFFEETAIKEVWSTTFNNWIRDSETVTLKTPLEYGLKRKAEITVLFAKEFEDRNEINGILKSWFVQTMTYIMREDMSNNLWFIEADNRLFIRDLFGQGICAPISIGESSPNYICQVSKPRKVRAEECLKIQKETKTAYVFNRVEIGQNGAIQSYITTC